MGAGYKIRNDLVIGSAFRRCVKSKDRVIEEGMKSLMENVMLAALSFHDDTHWIHKATENSYGWCVLHDGRSRLPEHFAQGCLGGLRIIGRFGVIPCGFR